MNFNACNLFNEDLTRKILIESAKSLQLSLLKTLRINVHRNHAFEPIQSIIAPFLYKAGICVEFVLSDYDDSLSFENIKPCDMELIYLDISRYKINIKAYLEQRLHTLRTQSKAPILVLLLENHQNFNPNLAQCEVFNIENLLNLPPQQLLDASKSEITGTTLSNKACIKLAQILGLSLIPSLVLPSLKALVLDLDNTLYDGILGEEGAENIVLTKAHKALQEKVLEYKQQGFLLAIASKNENKDVEEMFNTRKDFPLKLRDFDCIKANWNPKAQNLQEIAKFFNIGIDSMLFIDDNIAEIENVKHTGVKTLLARNPKEVLKNLQIFPQMRKTFTNKEDSLRSSDIRANKEREKLLELQSREYFENLQIELEFNINDKKSVTRIYELLNKTNQFIANYTRPSLEQVNLWLNSQEYAIISISMKDRLSDSGNIAIVVGHKNKERLEIIDLVVSCRALGRKLEALLLAKSFEILATNFHLDSKGVLLYYQKGERNMPFLEVLRRISKQPLKNIESQKSIKLEILNPDYQGLKIIELIGGGGLNDSFTLSLFVFANFESANFEPYGLCA